MPRMPGGVPVPSGAGARRSSEGELLGALFPKTLLEPGEHPFGQRSIYSYPSMHIDPAIYLRAMTADVRLAGGTIVIRDFQDVEAVVDLEQPLIVNSTGLGARELFDDDELVPIKGQISILRPQPEIDYLTYTVDGALYMMPRQSGVILGGTEERGVESLEPDPRETERILEGHRRLFGEMAETRALAVGSRIAHYDVTALIGEGGMGQVYRARDTKFD